jgi:hypothetical protein
MGMMFMQLVVYPRLQRRFGTLPVYRTMLAVTVMVLFAQGFIREFAQRQLYQALWTVLIITLFLKSASTTVLFTSSMILVASHGANSDKRGCVFFPLSFLSNAVSNNWDLHVASLTAWLKLWPQVLVPLGQL